MLKPNIQICGIQGSGKGTQSRILARETGYTVISTGELLRQSQNTQLLAQINQGNLAQDEQVIELVERYLSGHAAITGIIGDGMLRRQSQLVAFESIWQHDGYSAPYLIELYLPVAIARQRIFSRGMQDNGLRRDDLTTEAIDRRLALYESETLPILSTFSKIGRYTKIDATQSIEEVASQVIGVVKEVYGNN